MTRHSSSHEVQKRSTPSIPQAEDQIPDRHITTGNRVPQGGLMLCDQIIRLLLPAGAPITLAVDDTLFKRAGKKVYGAFWHHDGAAKGPKPIGYGNCWVVAGIIVDLPFLSRPVCLPVLARLWRPRQAGKIAHARELAELLAARYPDRTVHVVGDAAYVGERLRDVDARISWT